ncbi:hypothetical protein GCM10017783_11610 [Deinococcus piscis]|uniref:Uncharacterized protein n=2 Tax=Deinococcus piscis TaxID=394230 RepID=A0ABQ3K344_9DEIO|nr:hypothetical protein GCM10017783_11610 [Deinococcus piscis]
MPAAWHGGGWAKGYAGSMHPILWINGPFGVGKTQAAYALAQRLPGSFVCDPEQLGFALQRMTPPLLRGDFQDIPLWRSGTREAAPYTAAAQSSSP